MRQQPVRSRKFLMPLPDLPARGERFSNSVREKATARIAVAFYEVFKRNPESGGERR